MAVRVTKQRATLQQHAVQQFVPFSRNCAQSWRHHIIHFNVMNFWGFIWALHMGYFRAMHDMHRLAVMQWLTPQRLVALHLAPQHSPARTHFIGYSHRVRETSFNVKSIPHSGRKWETKKTRHTAHNPAQQQCQMLCLCSVTTRLNDLRADQPIQAELTSTS